MSSSIYHEHQVKGRCALHALNNLFQEKDFNKHELDEICYNLSPDYWINPHKSVLGLGFYDINVIMAALQSRGYEAIWFDKRKDPNSLDLDNIKGFILNVPSDYKFGFVPLPFNRKHWIAIGNIDGSFYNLDSKLDSPELIGQDNELLEYLKEQIDDKDKELFLVVLQEVEKTQSWLKITDNLDNIRQEEISTDNCINNTQNEEHSNKVNAENGNICNVINR